MLDMLRQDVRYTLVTMRRSIGFTAAALMTLALGIGATTAVFSVVYGVLLRPLPYPDAGRLVRLSEEHPGANSPLRQKLLSNLTYHAWTPDAVAGQRGRMNVLWAMARLKTGVTPQQAEAEGTAAARSTIRPMAANVLFGVGGPPIVHVRGVVDEMTSQVRASLLVLAAGVACLLLIACANVASLFLTRGVARQRELMSALRSAPVARERHVSF